MKLAIPLIAVLLLGGCGGSPMVENAPAPNAAVHSQADSSTQYAVLARFTDYPSGARPSGGLIDVGGTFYGVTRGGGLRGCSRSFCGTVYSLTPDGTKRVVYKFKGGSDGYRPAGRLLDVGGTLYGTTESGGAGCDGSGYNGCGTVFSVTTSGSEKVLYQFAGGSDGAVPTGDLVDVNGVLYGTTTYGGSDAQGCVRAQIHGCGTVYSVSTAGAERVLHRFASNADDGAFPVAGLTAIGNTLYGATYSGLERSGAGGIVFSMTPNGSEKIVHRFKGAPDASNPWSRLTYVHGTMYGTSAVGGKHRSGAVFSITTKGVEKVVYSYPGAGNFGFSPGRGNPVTYFDGHLYVAQARLWGADCGDGCGSLYSITLNGGATVLHEFDGGSDGCVPSSGLLALNGVLYGATSLGGQGKIGCHSSSVPGGTVYSWTP